MSLLRELEWLRPAWLWALLALPLLPFALRRLAARGSAWTRSVDAHLLPHLLDAGATRGSRTPAALLVLGAALALLALAGPSLRQQRAALWQVRSPLVVAVDMSAAMRATDLKPSRAAQARYELSTLLKERRGGQVGLLAYAGDAYSVAPLTRDARTVAALVDQLEPDIMPEEGQRADRAIQRAMQLMRDAGFTAGDILLLTDEQAQAGMSRVAANGLVDAILVLDVAPDDARVALARQIATPTVFIGIPDDNAGLVCVDHDFEAAAAQAAQATGAIFERKHVEGLPVGEALPTVEVARSELGRGIGVVELFRRSGLVPSNSEARRLIRGGGARLNEVKVEDETMQVNADHLVDGRLLLSAGRKRHAWVRAI